MYIREPFYDYIEVTRTGDPFNYDHHTDNLFVKNTSGQQIAPKRR